MIQYISYIPWSKQSEGRTGSEQAFYNGQATHRRLVPDSAARMVGSRDRLAWPVFFLSLSLSLSLSLFHPLSLWHPRSGVVIPAVHIYIYTSLPCLCDCVRLPHRDTL
jgi:hypothetical protein